MIYHVLCLLFFNLCHAGIMQSKSKEYKSLPSSHVVKITDEENLNKQLAKEKIIENLTYQEEIKKELHQEFVSTFADKSMIAEEIPRHIKLLFETCLWQKIEKTVATKQFNGLYDNFLLETRIPRTQLIKLLLKDHQEALRELQNKRLVDAIPSAAVVPI